jgi:hypothetical protein
VLESDVAERHLMPMTTPSYQDLDAPLGFTPAAAAKVAALIADEGKTVIDAVLDLGQVAPRR